MSYPPYCICCGSKAHWSCDYDTSDYGYEVEGIVGVYNCSNENCGASHEIVDFFINENEDQRVIKYTRDEDITVEEEMISSCLYCSSTLTEVSVSHAHNNYNTEFECEGVSTKLKCEKCNITYDVVDLYPIDEVYSSHMIDVRDSRTIFIINENK